MNFEEQRKKFRDLDVFKKKEFLDSIENLANNEQDSLKRNEYEHFYITHFDDVIKEYQNKKEISYFMAMDDIVFADKIYKDVWIMESSLLKRAISAIECRKIYIKVMNELKMYSDVYEVYMKEYHPDIPLKLKKLDGFLKTNSEELSKHLDLTKILK